ncbi:MAG TPA: CHAD domain-containing protein [Bryobacteraceae bacterium]|jgi:CHAD domain-containing protein|nr:CHAD domain-containing protein [Bryobacteraceae bacterium]
MAYKLKNRASVSADLPAIVQDKLQTAAKGLSSGAGTDQDRAVHEARKSVKRARAVLRLLKPVLGGAYATDNATLGELGRQLSKIRDSAALLEIFDHLVKKEGDGADREDMAPIRQGLASEKQALASRQSTRKTLDRIAHSLSAKTTLTKSWPALPCDGWQAIAPGLQRTYRQGRRALRTAAKKHTPDSFHELRKRVKDHFFHLDLLTEILGEATKSRAAECKDLEQVLGDDHNSVLLQERLRENKKKYAGRPAVRSLLRLIRSSQRNARGRSLSAAKTLYKAKPSAFVEQLGKAWNESAAVTARKPRKPAASSRTTTPRKKQSAA